MSVNHDLREELPEEAIVFDNASFDRSIIGVTTNGQVVYDYDSMVIELMEDDGISEEEAIDWICYNTLRALPYAGEMAPIVIYRLDGDSYVR